MNGRLLLVAAAGGPQGGVHALAPDPARRTLRALAVCPLSGASYFAFSPDRTRLYVAVSASARFPGDGEVAAYAVAPDGGLTFLNSLPSGGLSCCHLVVWKQFVYCANYRGGTVGEFRRDAEGGLGHRSQLIRHEGRSVHPERQTSAHPHFTGVTPDGRFLAVVDLGCDGIFFYSLDAGTGVSPRPSGFSPVEPGEGPRHLVFNAAGTVAYVANELGNSVSIHAYGAGALRRRGSVPTLPPGTEIENTVAAIRLAPDGRRLFVSNRGHDSIAWYDVLADGGLRAGGWLETQGRGPRDFILLEEGRQLAVVNERSGTVAILPGPGICGGVPLVAALPADSRPIGVVEIVLPEGVA